MCDFLMCDLHFRILSFSNFHINYSLLKLFTGLAIAAFIA